MSQIFVSVSSIIISIVFGTTTHKTDQFDPGLTTTHVRYDIMSSTSTPTQHPQNQARNDRFWIAILERTIMRKQEQITVLVAEVRDLEEQRDAMTTYCYTLVDDIEQRRVANKGAAEKSLREEVKENLRSILGFHEEV